MQDLENFVLLIFGGILTVAIVSVLVGSNSKFPAAIQATSSGLSNIVGTAVNSANSPANNGSNSFSLPAGTMGTLGSFL